MPAPAGNAFGATHGLAGRGSKDPKRHPAYNRWRNIRQRCNNPNHPRYKDYGDRGIWVWPDWSSFTQFLADMGEPPGARWEMYSVDRIDNDGPYAPWNCKWSTAAQQRANQTRMEEGYAWMLRFDEHEYAYQVACEEGWVDSVAVVA